MSACFDLLVSSFGSLEELDLIRMANESSDYFRQILAFLLENGQKSG